MNDRIKGLAALRQQVADIVGSPNAVELELEVPGDDGGTKTEVFEFPHPQLFSDVQSEAFNEAAKTGGGGPVPPVKAMLNNDADQDPYKYDRFRAAGGQCTLVMALWNKRVETAMRAGGSDPK